MYVSGGIGQQERAFSWSREDTIEGLEMCGGESGGGKEQGQGERGGGRERERERESERERVRQTER